MTIYKYEVKQDKRMHWHTLSVTTKEPMNDGWLAMYAEQWALGQQVNPDMVAIRCIDEQGYIVAVRESNAYANRAKPN